MPCSITVDLIDQTPPPCPLSDEHLIRSWINTLYNHTPKAMVYHEMKITGVFVDAQESNRLNIRFRGKAKPTNVLSFSQAEWDGELDKPSLMSLKLEGILIFCSDIVKAEAESKNISIQDHLAHLWIHGTLHLLGYDHEDDEQADIMETLEVDILQQLGIGNPYIDNERT